MTPAELNAAVVAAVRGAVDEGEFAVPVPGRVPVTVTESGDYATPLPLRLARAAGRPAREIAELLAERLGRMPGVGDVRVTGPGFLSIGVDTALIGRIDETYGVVPVPVPRETWPERPLTFDNPGFVVRFAYARAAAVRRQAADLGVGAAEGPLTDPREKWLLALLAEFPSRAEQAARTGDPRPFTRQLELIADAYHDVHEWCSPLPRGDEIITGHHSARLSLAEAAYIVLGNGLRMLGETPNDRL
ncbi:DALR anticodon-binding domain-containing protein [Actinoallomurus spadix]|uniref:arginine--tRNA ligase n=1 Tax=Actinoallomurus spadix TaxID=79912 RepID=A0ABP3FIT0_9ACTN|nr:DALR anticodon-binding domain-containing protein [Actinoallomurus spadix]MCO5990079.1 DALR anticodon-binding domain-containing protein [Actinoallomurus spadix]